MHPETFRISRLVNNLTGIERFKAPKGFQYEICDIHATVSGAGANTLIIVDYLAEDELAFIPFSAQAVAYIGCHITISGIDLNFAQPQKAKFISFSLLDSTTATILVVISGKVVKLTKKQAILEWFMKGR